MENMEGNEMDDVAARESRQGTTKKGLQRLHYRRVLRRDELVKDLVLKKLGLTARDVLSWKAVGERVTEYDAAQRAATAIL